jgi:glycosyltransferase involved in cell wall biosynthesis
MNDREKIDAYLLDELYKEICERDKDEVDQYTRFVYKKARELYWTLSRRFGAGHLHDGSWRVRNQKAATLARPILDADIPSQMAHPRVLIDVTHTHYAGERTGIQRVVREIARAAAVSGEGLPVFLENGRLLSHFRHASLPDLVEISEGDTFLMLDTSWGHVEAYLPILKEVSRKRGSNIVCLYDLIALLYPQACLPHVVRYYRDWFDKIVLASDAIVCISKNVAEEFCEYVRLYECGRGFHGRVGWFHLGADFRAPANEPPSQSAVAIRADAIPYYLSVGTIEPRKGYTIALTAFEKLWSAGVDARYVIVGRYGWNLRALQRRILEHPEFGQRLFWLSDASDVDIDHLYEGARALIIPSFAEGFGLPIVEAMGHNLPVIASDAPIFREIGGDAVAYFDLLNCDSLAQCIAADLARQEAFAAPPVRTWEDAAKQLLDIVRNNKYQIVPN